MSTEKSNSEKATKTKKQTSWIWQYFKEITKEIIIEGEEEKKEVYLVMQCQVKETPSSPICGKEYIRKDSFTGNAISHLRLKHDITQIGKVSIQYKKS
jgi:hypothetical protein